MATVDELKRGLSAGIIAGIIAGLVFGIGLARLGMIVQVALVAGSTSAIVAWAIHLTTSAVIGLLFGLLFQQAIQTAGAGLLWGLAYGLLGWFLGPLTAMPLLLGRGLGWSLQSLRQAFPSLIGHLIFGIVLGLGFAILRRSHGEEKPGLRQALRHRFGPIVGGAIAGLVGLPLYRLVLGTAGVEALTAAAGTSSDLLTVIVLSAGLGALYGLWFRSEATGHGSALARGIVYGVIVWVGGTLTLVPSLKGAGLVWTLAGASAVFEGLIALVLNGVLIALILHTLERLWQALFSDQVTRARADEGLGARSLRAAAWGSIASIAGGFAFSVVMVWMDLLPTVAGLVGASSALVGFIVHMIISVLIGATYGLLFRREASTLGAGIAWGMVYGVFWWILGPLTLMPLLLGQGLFWSPLLAQNAFPSLVGHLAYGAATALAYQVLASRYSEWGQPEPPQRMVFSGAAALWASILMLGLALPLLFVP